MKLLGSVKQKLPALRSGFLLLLFGFLLYSLFSTHPLNVVKVHAQRKRVPPHEYANLSGAQRLAALTRKPWIVLRDTFSKSSVWILRMETEGTRVSRKSWHNGTNERPHAVSISFVRKFRVCERKAKYLQSTSRARFIPAVFFSLAN